MKDKFKLIEVEYNDGSLMYSILMPDNKMVLGVSSKKQETGLLVEQLNRVVSSIEDFSDDTIEFIPSYINKVSILKACD